MVNPLQNEPLRIARLRSTKDEQTAASPRTRRGSGIAGELLAGLERARLDLSFLDQILAVSTGASPEASALARSVDQAAPLVLDAARQRLDRLLAQLVAHIGDAERTKRTSPGDGCGACIAINEPAAAAGLRPAHTATRAATAVVHRSISHRRKPSQEAGGVGAAADPGTRGAG